MGTESLSGLHRVLKDITYFFQLSKRITITRLLKGTEELGHNNSKLTQVHARHGFFEHVVVEDESDESLSCLIQCTRQNMLFSFTFTSPPSTVSTWMKHKILLMVKCVILLKTSRTSKIIRLNTFTSASWSPSTSINVYFPECDTKFSRSLQLFLVLSLNFFSKFLMAASAVDGLAKLFWPDSPWNSERQQKNSHLLDATRAF